MRALAEVALGRRLDAVRAGAQVDLVEVELEDLVLRVLLLDLARDLGLADLAREARETAALPPVDALREDVARELHRDGREPFGEMPGLEVVEHGAGHPHPVDAGMLVEAL